MHRVLLLGAGKIGRMIARLLVDTGDYDVVVGDSSREALELISSRISVKTVQLNVESSDELAKALAGRDTVISALSYYHNPRVAEAALAAGASYFDLTEDVETTRRVRAVAEKAKPGQVFMPQCGLAPGFISIVANDLAQQVEKLDTVRMRVGALPQFPTGALKYNLTWSTDGLINEYCNPCDAIHGGRRIEVLPLEGYEQFSLDGVRYEAFNTSGGLGTLCESLDGKVRDLNYKTVRYLGHCNQVQLLVNELRLSERRDLLKDILENAVPITFQDVVVTFCTVTGYRNGQLVQITDARKIYHQEIGGENWSAIQVTTAAGICAVIDMHVAGQLNSSGFLRQEDVDFANFLGNRFGRHYDTRIATRFSNASSVGGATTRETADNEVVREPSI
ncbi:saccharopine dehydrogenase family protein [Lacipirellula parvula]|uniref:Putative dehydrogenase n=1 Tax=Lacipirellula parvula TaxID=2650471 RepID=A0A5K7X779_9BACT|nr:saccharopine dehydrogenase NADP-binding domain-containing protein [Lacipirellula parvula]BBO32594.1 putative dehydrogenase [Lacipirellula parvula]